MTQFVNRTSSCTAEFGPCTQRCWHDAAYELLTHVACTRSLRNTTLRTADGRTGFGQQTVLRLAKRVPRRGTSTLHGKHQADVLTTRRTRYRPRSVEIGSPTSASAASTTPHGPFHNRSISFSRLAAADKSDTVGCQSGKHELCGRGVNGSIGCWLTTNDWQVLANKHRTCPVAMMSIITPYIISRYMDVERYKCGSL